MQTTSEARAWLNDTVSRIVARHPLPEAERVGIRYELTSHLHSAAEARAREAGRDEVTVGELRAALSEMGGEEALAEAFVRPRSVLPARAGFGRRAAAYLVDLAILYAGIFVAWGALYLVLAPLVALAGGSIAYLRPDPFQLLDVDDLPWRGVPGGVLALVALVGVLLALLTIAIPLTYFAWFESHGGRTPGKKALDLRVLREDGAPATPREAVLRNLLKASPFFMFPLVLLDGLFILFEDRRQRASDRIVGTVVVQEGAR